MSLKIIKAGLLDSVQDGGRRGYAHIGIPPCGAMDPFSASLANALLGKKLTDPVIEIHFPGPLIEVTSSCILVVTGADFGAAINNVSLPLGQPARLSAGDVLEFKKPVTGARAYIGLYPGMQVDSWVGSASTDLKVKTGGYQGRRLQKGDNIRFTDEDNLSGTFKLLPWRSHFRLASGPIGVITGPEWEGLEDESRQRFFSQEFIIDRQSDRMGFRLNGQALKRISTKEMLSSAVSSGTIQMLPDGNLVVLMADHATTGGYPRIGAVVRADAGRLAQIAPGGALRFRRVEIEEAEKFYLSQIHYLNELKALSRKEMKSFLKS